MGQLASVVDGQVGIVFDDRFAPILIATWFGCATARIVDAFYDWNDAHLGRAEAAGHRVIVINDALDSERPPATVRRLIAERAAKVQDLNDRVALVGCVVLSSAVVRGALTAIRWLNPRIRFVAVSSCAEALLHARRALSEAGVSPPELDPADYVRPPRPGSAKAMP